MTIAIALVPENKDSAAHGGSGAKPSFSSSNVCGIHTHCLTLWVYCLFIHLLCMQHVCMCAGELTCVYMCTMLDIFLSHYPAY